MSIELYRQSLAEVGIYEDLQKIIRVGFHRFRRRQLSAIPRAGGYSNDNIKERAACIAIRKVIEEQIGFLPTDEWQLFAEHLFGLTVDTVGRSAGERERIAGESLEGEPAQSTVRRWGGVRERVVSALADQIIVWGDDNNPGWRDSFESMPRNGLP